jgi:uncharacterized protein GlcG (DUF336 family)
MESISLQDARRVIAAAEAKAQEIGQPMDIAVVDDGGHLRAHVRMDGALIASIHISLNKAYSAIALKMETKNLVELTQPGQPLFGLSDSRGRADRCLSRRDPADPGRTDRRGDWREQWHGRAGSGGR